MKEENKIELVKNTFLYEGRGFTLAKISFINLLLSLVTLGIYSFWARTRVRKYITSQLSLDSDSFAYTGTGKELFLGFIKIFPLFVLVIVIISFINFDPLTFIVYLGIFFMAIAGIYAGLKYKYSRLMWRGVNGKLEGSIFRYAFFYIKWMFLKTISLGFLGPRADLRRYEYVINKTSYGNLSFEYNFHKQSLHNVFKVHVYTMLLFILSIAAVFGGIAILDFVPKAVGILIIILGVFGFLTSRIPYHVSLLREKLRGLYLDGTYRFKTTLNSKEFIIFNLKMIALVICTLGFALPWVVNSTMRFHASHLIVGGDLSKLRAKPVASNQDNGDGEAIEDVFSGDDLGVLGY